MKGLAGDFAFVQLVMKMAERLFLIKRGPFN